MRYSTSIGLDLDTSVVAEISMATGRLSAYTRCVFSYYMQIMKNLTSLGEKSNARRSLIRRNVSINELWFADDDDDEGWLRVQRSGVNGTRGSCIYFDCCFSALQCLERFFFFYIQFFTNAFWRTSPLECVRSIVVYENERLCFVNCLFYTVGLIPRKKNLKNRKSLRSSDVALTIKYYPRRKIHCNFFFFFFIALFRPLILLERVYF